MRFLKNEKGLTLIEILVAITLLSIVLITFFTIFIQSAKFTHYNKEKLTAIDVGEKVVGDIRNLSSYKQLLQKGYRLENGVFYVNDTTYAEYKVKIEIKEIISSKLRRIKIDVTSIPQSNIADSFFTTEMYIKEEETT
ncbi:type IV pilus modification PilV family protein [Bacillus sp. FJAT-29937]|uniref:type IV pilus modification PilV family protein n=1 Tax=Bacillus sp. FJAT-29937 TaxID=1720553 RepID=UPI0008335ACC|nr:prepilin-type N-terminal cleavage/methylation domain-containing protein [Bacillus sp. FJAT-29937]